MKNFNSILNEKFKDKEFSKAYHRTATFYRLADELLLLRKKRGLSQKELAEAAGTTQAVVSRLENASVKASLESVVKFAEALDAFVDVKLLALEEMIPKNEEKILHDGEISRSLISPYYFQLKQSGVRKEKEYVKIRNIENSFVRANWSK